MTASGALPSQLGRRARIQRLAVRNYKSLARCDIELSNLTFLVGINGAGKSNLIEALTLIPDALRGTLEEALRERGGAMTLRRPLGSRTVSGAFDVEVELVTADGRTAEYALTIAPTQYGAPTIDREQCRVAGGHWYEVTDGQVTGSILNPPQAGIADRLYLMSLTGHEAFRAVHDALVGVEAINPVPALIRAALPTDSYAALTPTGVGLSSVLQRVEKDRPETLERITTFLRRVVPELQGVGVKNRGGVRVVEFSLAPDNLAASKIVRPFSTRNVSEGTLRVLTLFLALLGSLNTKLTIPTLIAVEEPELALHPAAMSVVLDVLREGSLTRQIIVTTHSPDLLRDVDIDRETILVATSERGETRIAGLDQVSVQVIRDHLYHAGELLQMRQLQPEEGPRA